MVEQGRQRWKARAAVLAAFLTLGALTLGAFWPTPILGVDDKALQNSVDRLARGSCDPLPDDKWRCSAHETDYMDVTFYRVVHINRMGCWRAFPEGRNGVIRRSNHRSGCIRISDHLL